MREQKKLPREGVGNNGRARNKKKEQLESHREERVEDKEERKDELVEHRG